MNTLTLGDCESQIQTDPFPHFVTFLPEVRASKSLFEKSLYIDGLWKLHEESFYSQWENSKPVASVDSLHVFCSEAWISEVRQYVEQALQCELCDEYKINLLRLEAGQSINIHNDSPLLGYETHRVLVYLTDLEDDFQGGELVLFRSRDSSSIATAYRPRAGLIFGFEASNTSFHGVMPVTKGSRLALQYYFWHRGNDPQVENILRSFLVKGIEMWEQLDVATFFYRRLCSQKTLQLAHGNNSLIEHLRETAALLHAFGSDESVCLAGLVHSVEGTKNFSANGSLDAILVGYAHSDEVVKMVRLFSNLKDDRDLLNVILTDQIYGDRLLQIWWANVLSSKCHIAFSKQRYREELRVYRNTRSSLVALNNLLDSIYFAKEAL